MKNFVCSLLLLVAISVSSLSFGAEEAIKYNVYLTNEVRDNYPTQKQMTEFTCSDRIYIVVEAVGMSSEKHRMTVSWKDPVSAQQQLTDYEFDGHAYNRIWAWLELSGPAGGVIGQVFDPSFGMEEFIGEWLAEVTIDRKKVSKLPFNVLC